ncbi:MAG TPA: sulfur carrier protein ThiS [Abditibacteriaceae bacterium]|jgi:sulfur carrier protein
MRIKLNGEYSETAAGTIAHLLRELETPSVGVAVALNGQVVRKAEHDTAVLNENDEIELIRAVQGG